MPISPFHALYKTRTLASYASGKNKLLPVFVSSDVEVFPYQVAAALFALRSPYLKGCILCDEGSLGKTFESLLIVTQMWYEGKNKILIVLPTHLIHQWAKQMDNRFSVPFVLMDSESAFFECIKDGQANPFVQESVVVTTYDFAVSKADYISQIKWDLTVYDEADRLCNAYTGENKTATALKAATEGSFRLLLTPTPITKSILDIYGLIYFIDQTVFADEKIFYNRYFRHPENYEELADRVSRYCFRTLRSQVKGCVKIPERIVITADFVLTDKEQRLYDLIEKYIGKSEKLAFPKMDSYDLSLMLFRTFSSSTFATLKTLKGVVFRLGKMRTEASHPNDKLEQEYHQFMEMLTLAESIKENAKGIELLKALEKGFDELKRLGGNKKALIFTENIETQKYLFSLLNKGKYKGKVLTYNGSKTRDYTIMERFESEAQILITTDIAAKGLDIEFCSLVVNYDMPYNTLKVEQRINRCHRQGQKCDVIVLNFLNRNNFADVRMLELINKRILQFDGIFGISDDVIGGFSTDLESGMGKILANARTKVEIDRAFDEVLVKYAAQNKQIVKTAEQSLFTSFDSDIAETVTITPQYIKDMTVQIENSLWEITNYFFKGKQGYTCEDETRTLRIGIQPQKVFTGAHLGRREYSMTDKTLPKSGWHNITGTLAKNIMGEILWHGIPDSGSIEVESDDLSINHATIAFYEIKIKTASNYFSSWRHRVFVGRTADGKLLTDEQCREIMELPVVTFSASGETVGERDGISKPKKAHELDDLVETKDFAEKTLTEIDAAHKEEIKKLKAYTADLKIGLERNLDSLRAEIKSCESGLGKIMTRLDKLDKQKKLHTLQKELKQREQNLFMDGLRLDVALEEKIKQMVDEAKLAVTVRREFVIQVSVKNKFVGVV